MCMQACPPTLRSSIATQDEPERFSLSIQPTFATTRVRARDWQRFSLKLGVVMARLGSSIVEPKKGPAELASSYNWSS